VFTPERLATFLADLRLSGFSIGHHEQQRIVDLLFYLQSESAMPESSEQLSNMLGAILCRSAEQQNQFRRQFTNFFGAWTARRRSYVAPTRPVDEPKSASGAKGGLGWRGLAPTERQMLIRGTVAFTICVVFLLALEVAARRGWLSTFVNPAPTPAPEISMPAFAWLRTMLSSVESWFAWAMPGAYSAFVALNRQLGAATPFLTVPIFALVAIWIVAPGRPFAAYLNRRKVDYRPQLVRLLVQAATVNPFLDRNFNRRAQILRRPRMVDSRELDVDASLNTTLAHAGLFSPVFARRPLAPEYLVLIDRLTGNDHLTAYAETLVSALRQAQVYVTVYYYNADIRRLFAAADSPAVTFEDVAAKCPEHRLIVIGDGGRFFDPVTGHLRSWATLMQVFARRVFLTPCMHELWGYREKALQAGLETQVLPLRPDAISTMVELLAGEQPPRLSEPMPIPGPRTEAAVRLANMLEDRPVRWIDTGDLGSDTLTALDRALRQSLPLQTYEWLAACAVYPELTWNMTIHVGQATAALPFGVKMSESLLQLSNLPWFRIGRMPLWLRQMLTAGMSPKLYGRVREILNGLLLTTILPTRKNVAIEAGLTWPGMSDDASAIEGRLPSQLQDPILIDFMSRSRSDRTAVKLPRPVARLFAQGGWLHNVLANSQLEDISASADILNAFVENAHVEGVEVKPPAKSDNLEVELRAVTGLIGRADNVIAPPDDCYLYLPAGDKPARLLDQPALSLYRQRRHTMFKFASWNVATLLLFGVIFYGSSFNQSNPGVATVIVALWLIGPFLLLYAILVRPVMRRIDSFPAFLPADGNPRHLCLLFTGDGAPLKAASSRVTAASEPKTMHSGASS
jgi:hypothetical protein